MSEELELKSISLDNDSNCENYLSLNFVYKGKLFGCRYYLAGDIEYCDYEEQEDEDIYELIHNYIEDHIETHTTVYLDGKDINEVKK